MKREFFIGAIDERSGLVCLAEFAKAESFFAALELANHRAIANAGHADIRLTSVAEQASDEELFGRLGRIADCGLAISDLSKKAVAA